MDTDKQYALLVVTFEGKDTAKEALKVVKKLKKHKALELVDVVAASKKLNGHVKLTQGKELTAKKGAAYFGTAGLVAGALLGGPIGGLVLGAALGGVVGKTTDKGFDNKTLKELANDLDRDSSAIFMVATEIDSEAVEGAFDDFGGKMQSFLIAGENFVALGDAAVDEVYVAVVEEDEAVEVETVDVDEEPAK